MRTNIFAVELNRVLKGRAFVLLCCAFALGGVLIPIFGSEVGLGVGEPLSVIRLVALMTRLSIVGGGLIAGSHLIAQKQQPFRDWFLSLPVKTRDLAAMRLSLAIAGIWLPICIFVATMCATVELLQPGQGSSSSETLHFCVLGLVLWAIPNGAVAAAFVTFVASLVRRTELIFFALLAASLVLISLGDLLYKWSVLYSLIDASGVSPLELQLASFLRAGNEYRNFLPRISIEVLLNRAVWTVVGGFFALTAARLLRAGLPWAGPASVGRNKQFAPSSQNIAVAVLPHESAAKASQILEISRLTLRLRLSDLTYWTFLIIGVVALALAQLATPIAPAPSHLFNSFASGLFEDFAPIHTITLVMFALGSRFDIAQRNFGTVARTFPVTPSAWFAGWAIALVAASAMYQLLGATFNAILQWIILPDGITISGHIQAALLSWFSPMMFGLSSLAIICFISSKRLAALTLAVLFIGRLTLGSFGIPGSLFALARLPPLPWSDFTGFELGLQRWMMWAMYWFAVTAGLAILAAHAGAQGPSSRSARRKGSGGWMAAAISICSATVLGAVLYRSSRGPSEERTNTLRTRYESLYRKVANDPELRLYELAGRVNIDTSSRKAVGDLRYMLVNETSLPINIVHFDWSFGSGTKIVIQGCRELERNEDLGFATCLLPKAVAPGAKTSLSVNVTLKTSFGQDERKIGYVTPSAAILESSEFLPWIGYNPDKELVGITRRESGQFTEPPLIDVEGRRGEQVSSFHGQGQLALNLLVQTDKPMKVIAPRQSSSASPNFIIAAGNWTKTSYVASNGISLEIYHHPLHTEMLPTIASAATEAIDYGFRNFGPLWRKSLCIVEARMMLHGGATYDNAILLPEATVFNPPPVPTWDIEGYAQAETVAHEIAHLWWPYEVNPAAGPGSEFLTESFAQYMALMVRRRVDKERGYNHMLNGIILRLERHYESTPEVTPPLSQMHHQEVLAYDAGPALLTMIAKIIGEKDLNDVLRNYTTRFDVHTHPNSYPTLVDFRNLLDSKMAADEKKFVDHEFDSTSYTVDQRTERNRKVILLSNLRKKGHD